VDLHVHGYGLGRRHSRPTQKVSETTVDLGFESSLLAPVGESKMSDSDDEEQLQVILK
jgi:hypothetical protein